MISNLWNHVIDGRKRLSNDADDCAELARKLGYTMFVWNDSLYRVPDSPNAAWDSEPLRVKMEELE